jgi:hypothetical protein
MKSKEDKQECEICGTTRRGHLVVTGAHDSITVCGVDLVSVVDEFLWQAPDVPVTVTKLEE